MTLPIRGPEDGALAVDMRVAARLCTHRMKLLTDIDPAHSRSQDRH